MSRRRNEEQPFGSDSFLDIVANIVGILIILIVIAGVRVRMSPRKTPPTASVNSPEQMTHDRDETPLLPLLADDPEPETVPDPPVIVAIVEPPAEPKPAPRPEPSPPGPPPLPPPPELPKVVVPEHLRREVEALQTQIASTQAASETADRARVRNSKLLNELQKSLSNSVSQVRQHESALRNERKLLSELKREVNETLDSVTALRRRIDETEIEPETEVIEHRVTPIGRAVSGQELHFLLQGNLVVPVPVDELAGQLSAQIQRKKPMLIKLEQYEGTIGPVKGFEMTYLIEKVKLSLSEQLKYGQAVVRMNVTRWTLLPVDGVQFESTDKAFQRGSRFYNALLKAGPLATITLWVYPDSFEVSREIQEFAHRHGYEVASRPLPFGVPITGSPDGSKSIAQ